MIDLVSAIGRQRDELTEGPPPFLCLTRPSTMSQAMRRTRAFFLVTALLRHRERAAVLGLRRKPQTLLFSWGDWQTATPSMT